VAADAATALNIDSTSKFGWYASGVKFIAKGLYTVFVFADSADQDTTKKTQVRQER
jgi:hypothetical protein